MCKLKNRICTGCGACANVCSVQAITMKENEKGFLIPFINKEKCINCNACETVCPLNKDNSESSFTPKAYCFISKDEDILSLSTSGGAFALFAHEILKNQGVVFGAVYDENLKVCHKSATNPEELQEMHGSKYVQSNIKNTYKEAKSYLKQGKQVLYTGTPCQTAGLRSYLGKDYENLITTDIVCHGVPSRKIFELFKEELSKKYIDETIENIRFRPSEKPWGPFHYIKIKTNKNEYIINGEETSFIKAFGNLSINDSCLNCKFNKIPRYADITIGDFWGIENIMPDFYNEKGVSVILIHSEKGNNIFERLKCNGICKDLTFSDAVKYNYNVLQSTKPHKDREKFWKDIQKGKSLHKTVNKYVKKYPNILKFIYKKLLPPFIKNFIKRFL